MGSRTSLVVCWLLQIHENCWHSPSGVTLWIYKLWDPCVFNFLYVHFKPQTMWSLIVLSGTFEKKGGGAFSMFFYYQSNKWTEFLLRVFIDSLLNHSGFLVPSMLAGRKQTIIQCRKKQIWPGCSESLYTWQPRLRGVNGFLLPLYLSFGYPQMYRVCVEQLLAPP